MNTMNKHTLNKAYWRGFIKAADVVSTLKKAPELGPVITAAGNNFKTNDFYNDNYTSAVTTMSNLANNLKDFRTQTTDAATKPFSTNTFDQVFGSGTDRLSNTSRNIVADILIHQKELAAALENRRANVVEAAQGLTPELFSQYSRLQKEVDSTLHPTKELLDKFKHRTGLEDLESGYNKIKEYNILPWYKKMTGLHDKRPYLSNNEYGMLNKVTSDPLMENVVNQELGNKIKVVSMAKDVLQTPNMGTTLSRIGAIVPSLVTKTAPVQSWLTANAPILKTVIPTALKRLPGLPAALGLAAGVGGEMGNLAGRASVEGLSAIPKHFNEEMQRQAMGVGKGSYLLSVENNMSKPVASIVNLARVTGNPMQQLSLARKFLPLLFPEGWRTSNRLNPQRAPALPLPSRTVKSLFNQYTSSSKSI